MSNAMSKPAYFGISIIGIFPLLAPSTTLLSGLAMAAAFLTLVLVATLSISSIRGFIVSEILLPLCLLVNASWVVVLDRFMLAYCFELRELLGMYLPLLAVNAAVLLYLQQNASRANPVLMLKQIFRPLMLIVSLLVLTAAARELLATGSLVFPGSGESGMTTVKSEWFAGLTLFGMAPGAFICLGLILALVKYCLKKDIGIRIE